MQRIDYLNNITFLYLLSGMTLLPVLISLAKAYPVKRKIVHGIIILFITGSAVSFTGCKSGNSTETVNPRVSDIWNYKGWADEDTYRTVSTGMDCKLKLSAANKKECVKKYAINNAIDEITKEFKSWNHRGQGAYSEMTDYSQSASREIIGVIKSGCVIAEKYDENFNCTIVYEIKAKGFKKQVEQTDFK